MLQGRVSRLNARTTLGLALTILIASGCEQIPSPRANTAPIHIPQAASPAPPLHPPVESPSALQTTPPAVVPTNLAANVNPPTEKSSVSAATPLIDEALAKAEEIRRIDLESPESFEKSPLRTATLTESNSATISKSSTKGAASTPAASEPAPPAPAVEPSSPTAVASVVEPTKDLSTKLSSVNSPAIDPEKAASPPKPPAERWRDGLEQLRRLAREQGQKGDPSSSPWVLREQLLDFLDQAEDQASLRRSVLKSFLSLESNWAPSDPQERSREIREAILAIEEQAPLEITDLKICRKVIKFGDFEALDPSDCKPGQTLIVYCEVSGVRYAEAGETFRSHLSSQIELVPAQGGEAVLKQDIRGADDFCRRRRRDYFVNYRITLPEDLKPGSYELRLTQEDELVGQSASSKMTLTVHP